MKNRELIHERANTLLATYNADWRHWLRELVKDAQLLGETIPEEEIVRKNLLTEKMAEAQAIEGLLEIPKTMLESIPAYTLVRVLRFLQSTKCFKDDLWIDHYRRDFCRQVDTYSLKRIHQNMADVPELLKNPYSLL